MKIFVINAGSSSLKYQLFDMEKEEVLVTGICERIGIDGHIRHKPSVAGGEPYEEDYPLPNHSEAISAVLGLLVSDRHGVIGDVREIGSVGHRVAHGGEYFQTPVLITDEVMEMLEACVSLAPLHNPANISGINACKAVMGDIPMVAVFDTAFHQTMPKKAYTYAIPMRYYENYKIRRYGFHGTSHRYVAARAAEIIGRPLAELKLITCHMGNGSSVCAVDHGRSVDTSMGFTPLAGLPMGTRSGSVDNGILQFIMKKENLNMDQMMEILNKESGVLGISGLSSDFRDLLEAAGQGNERAQLAVDIFCYRAAKLIGGYAAAMNGVDGIVFTAGVGENSAPTRSNIAGYLGFLGCEFDDEANKQRGEVCLTKPGSRVPILVIPTNEELVIARDTKSIVDGLGKK